jgi:benzoyl-CoA 2,3-dioxygenase component B
VHTDPQGNPIAAEEWRARQADWLPTAHDRGFVDSLMQRVTEPGKFAGWIAPPEGGINNLSLNYEYVRAH